MLLAQKMLKKNKNEGAKKKGGAEDKKGRSWKQIRKVQGRHVPIWHYDSVLWPKKLKTKIIIPIPERKINGMDHTEVRKDLLLEVQETEV